MQATFKALGGFDVARLASTVQDKQQQQGVGVVQIEGPVASSHYATSCVCSP